MHNETSSVRNQTSENALAWVTIAGHSESENRYYMRAIPETFHQPPDAVEQSLLATQSAC